MTRRTTALVAALSLIPIGQPLILVSSTALATGVVVLSTQTAHAQSADDYLTRGNTKYRLRDYKGAIADYNKAIEINKQFALAYTNRGAAKRKSGDTQGAIADWTKVIEFIPKSGLSGLSYRNRGVDKAWIEDHEGACVDWKEAASLGDEDAAGWVKEFC